MDETDAPFRDDLDAALAEIWRRLARGAADRRSGFHTVQLATLGLDGAPRVRTVVLRGVEQAAGRLRVHTDRRSAKWAEIAAEPRVELHAYDPRAKLQVRMRGRILPQAEGPVADAAWAASSPGSRACYRAALAPGSALHDPAEADSEPALRAQADPQDGRDRFAALLLEATRVEWLWLAAGGHRRAAHERGAGERGAGWAGRWLAP
jgi:hypothetical protein